MISLFIIGDLDIPFGEDMVSWVSVMGNGKHSAVYCPKKGRKCTQKQEFKA